MITTNYIANNHFCKILELKILAKYFLKTATRFSRSVYPIIATKQAVKTKNILHIPSKMK